MKTLMDAADVEFQLAPYEDDGYENGNRNPSDDTEPWIMDDQDDEYDEAGNIPEYLQWHRDSKNFSEINITPLLM
jgi:hypothetical protein